MNPIDAKEYDRGEVHNNRHNFIYNRKTYRMYTYIAESSSQDGDALSISVGLRTPCVPRGPV